MGACVSINRPRFKTIKGRESAFHDITTRERSRSRQLNKRRLQRTAFQHKTSSRHPWHVQHSDTEISSTSNCLAEDISNNSRRHCVMEPLIRMAAPPITIMQQQQLPGQCDTTDDSADSNYNNREAIATASPATRGIIVVAECPAIEVTSHQQTDVDSSSDEDLLGYDRSHVIVVKPAEAAVVHPTCSGTVHTQCSTVNRSEPIPSPVECESLATILSSGYDSCVEPPTPERKKNNIIEEKNRLHTYSCSAWFISDWTATIHNACIKCT